MNSFYFLVRWFGLDTLFSVVCIQFFLNTFRSNVDLIFVFGILAPVSFIYILDRCRDIHIGDGDSLRHTLYKGRMLWVVFTLSVLFFLSLLFWFSLPKDTQLVILVCIILTLLHFWFLNYIWYQIVKDIFVALIFTVVMMIGLFDFYWLGLLLFSFTYFNLSVHRLIENGVYKRDFFILFLIFFVMFFLIFANFTLGYGVLVWLISIIGQLILIHFGFTLKFWYELGEVFFAVPFIFYAIYN